MRKMNYVRKSHKVWTITCKTMMWQNHMQKNHMQKNHMQKRVHDKSNVKKWGIINHCEN